MLLYFLLIWISAFGSLVQVDPQRFVSLCGSARELSQNDSQKHVVGKALKEHVIRIPIVPLQPHPMVYNVEKHGHHDGAQRYKGRNPHSCHGPWIEEHQAQCHIGILKDLYWSVNAPYESKASHL